MINYNKSWKNMSSTLEVAGAGFLFIFILLLPELLIGGDYFSLFLIFALGIVCIVSGVLIKRWARKNGKK